MIMTRRPASARGSACPLSRAPATIAGDACHPGPAVRVLAAMSGGVDSSVAAALLLEAGHQVEGVTLVQTCHPDPGPGCCSDSGGASEVAAQLGIPHVTLDYTDLFCRAVIQPFAAAYREGLTPNPCIECNRRVRFGALLDEARRRGCDALATGHHARLRRGDGAVPADRGDRPPQKTGSRNRDNRYGPVPVADCLHIIANGGNNARGEDKDRQNIPLADSPNRTGEGILAPENNIALTEGGRDKVREGCLLILEQCSVKKGEVVVSASLGAMDNTCGIPDLGCDRECSREGTAPGPRCMRRRGSQVHQSRGGWGS